MAALDIPARAEGEPMPKPSSYPGRHRQETGRQPFSRPAVERLERQTIKHRAAELE